MAKFRLLIERLCLNLGAQVLGAGWSIKAPAGRRHIIVLSRARIKGMAPAEADIDTVWQVEQT